MVIIKAEAEDWTELVLKFILCIYYYIVFLNYYILKYILHVYVCTCAYIFISIRASEALQSIAFNNSLSKTRGRSMTLVPVLMRETF